MKGFQTPAVIYTAFSILYMFIRGYWVRLADKRPTERSRTFLLDRLNITLVSVGVMGVPFVALYTHLLDREAYPLRASPLFAVPVLSLSLFFFWRSHRDLGENWSVTLAIKRRHCLVTHGVYRHIRHPMYTAMWLWVIGQALAVPNLIGGLSGILTWGLLYFTRVGREERMMREVFGDAYRRYARHTGRLLHL